MAGLDAGRAGAPNGPALLGALGVVLVIGVGSLIVAAWPFAFSDTRWRVQTDSVVLAAVPQFVLLLSMICVAGVYAGQHLAVRAASVGFFLLAALLIVIVPTFALDFMDQRHLQPQNVLGPFTREGMRLGVSAALVIPFLIWAGRKGWFAGRADSRDEIGEGHGLVVGQME